jgi:hypothetical protein
MSTHCTRRMTLTYTGDFTSTQNVDALENPASPGVVELRNLDIGANTITVPIATGATVVAVTIVPPPGNTNAILLKALPGDTGLGLHVTDPTTIALAPTQTSFVIDLETAIPGVRFFWS